MDRPVTSRRRAAAWGLGFLHGSRRRVRSSRSRTSRLSRSWKDRSRSSSWRLWSSDARSDAADWPSKRWRSSVASRRALERSVSRRTILRCSARKASRTARAEDGGAPPSIASSALRGVRGGEFGFVRTVSSSLPRGEGVGVILITMAAYLISA